MSLCTVAATVLCASVVSQTFNLQATIWNTQLAGCPSTVEPRTLKEIIRCQVSIDGGQEFS